MNNRIFTDKNLGSTFEYVDLFIMAILMFYEYNLSIIDKANRIYEFTYEGKTRRVAISIGSNGYIVGANPK